MKTRVLLKRLLSQIRCIPSYCRDCGLTVCDFHAPDRVWRMIYPDGNGVLCYNCFARRLQRLGHVGVFRLIELDQDRFE